MRLKYVFRNNCIQKKELEQKKYQKLIRCLVRQKNFNPVSSVIFDVLGNDEMRTICYLELGLSNT